MVRCRAVLAESTQPSKAQNRQATLTSESTQPSKAQNRQATLASAEVFWSGLSEHGLAAREGRDLEALKSLCAARPHRVHVGVDEPLVRPARASTTKAVIADLEHQQAELERQLWRPATAEHLQASAQKLTRRLIADAEHREASAAEVQAAAAPVPPLRPGSAAAASTTRPARSRCRAGVPSSEATAQPPARSARAAARGWMHQLPSEAALRIQAGARGWLARRERRLGGRSTVGIEDRGRRDGGGRGGGGRGGGAVETVATAPVATEAAEVRAEEQEEAAVVRRARHELRIAEGGEAELRGLLRDLLRCHTQAKARHDAAAAAATLTASAGAAVGTAGDAKVGAGVLFLRNGSLTKRPTIVFATTI